MSRILLSPTAGIWIDVVEHSPYEHDVTASHEIDYSETLLILDGINVPIGENLRDALRRTRERSSSPVRLWVDAICINQLDVAEKSTQVSVMGSIYGNASQVVAWLGEGDEHDNAAAKGVLQCLRAEQEEQNEQRNVAGPAAATQWHFVHHWQPERNQETFVPSSQRECRSCYEHVELTTPSHQQMAIKALFSLSRRRYFRRLRVVQEVSVPHSDRLMFQFGSHSLPGSPLELIRDRWSIDLYSVRARVTWPTSPLNPLSMRRSLVDWVVYGQRKACSDPRDKLYAVLSCPTSTSNATVRSD